MLLLLTFISVAINEQCHVSGLTKHRQIRLYLRYGRCNTRVHVHPLPRNQFRVCNHIAARSEHRIIPQTRTLPN